MYMYLVRDGRICGGCGGKEEGDGVWEGCTLGAIHSCILSYT